MIRNKTNLILNYIRYHPKCDITNIVSGIKDISKPTIMKILFSLLNDNLIIVEDGFYFLDPSLSEIKSNNDFYSDTYFDVYIKKEHKEMIYYLFDYISKIWMDIYDELPTKTQMYKLMSKINTKLNLGLPMVWYKFGQIPLVVFDCDKDYSNYDPKLINNIDSNKCSNIMKNIVYGDCKLSSGKMRDVQYYAYNDNIQVVYQKKLEIEKYLLESKFDLITKNMSLLVNYIPYFRDKDRIIERFNDVAHNYNDLDPILQNSYYLRTLYSKLFSVFWDVVATNNLKSDVWKYYEKYNVNVNRISNCDFDLKKLKEEFNYLEEEFYVKVISYSKNNN